MKAISRFRLLLIIGLSNIILNPSWGRSTSVASNCFVLGLKSETSDHERASQSRAQRRLTEKPAVYTFFHGVSNRTANTGMTQEADEKLLRSWKEEWTRNGWNPVVLSLDDAKKHKDYEAINALLDGGPFGEYDRYCFLRWLALAAVGGGYAADYDTFPLNFVKYSLPNDGKLTVHEESGDGGVPCLVSGNANEYTRFSWALARNAAIHKSEVHWSDMKAMQDLYKTTKGAGYLMQGNVISALGVLHGRGVDAETCELVAGKHAIHFSHHSIEFGKVPPGSGAQDRESIGKEWLKDWWKNCNKDKPLAAAAAAAGAATGASAATPQKAVKAEVANAPAAKKAIDATTPYNKEGAGSSRPLIHTFVGHTDAGKLEKHEKAMLQVWLKSWYEIGWEPRVLFYDAASKHTEYAKLYNSLTSITKTVSPQVFIRYLAMANVGGGWLSDFDLIPLGKFAERLLPNGGKVTIHETTKEGSGLPSLVSGSAEEYMRLSKSIVENAKNHGDSPSWDDIQSLQAIHKSSNGAEFSIASNVIAGQDALQGRDVDRGTCTRLEGKYAVHASPEAFKTDEDKATVTRDWVLAWRRKCLTEETVPLLQ